VSTLFCLPPTSVRQNYGCEDRHRTCTQYMGARIETEPVHSNLCQMNFILVDVLDKRRAREDSTKIRVSNECLRLHDTASSTTNATGCTSVSANSSNLCISWMFVLRVSTREWLLFLSRAGIGNNPTILISDVRAFKVRASEVLECLDSLSDAIDLMCPVSLVRITMP
jgi:hypothetical protein